MTRTFRALYLFGLFLLGASAVMADFSSPARNISNSALDSMYPKIAGTDNSPNLFLIWMEYESPPSGQRLRFAKSTNGGTTWSAPIGLTGPGQICSDSPKNAYSLCVEEPYLHVVFNFRNNDTEDWEIWYARSADLGSTWVSFQLTDNASSSVYPDVAVNGSYVHVIYQDNWPGNYDIMYQRITNYGNGPVDRKFRISYSSTDSYFPRIAAAMEDANVHIVWEEIRNGIYEIRYARSPNSGAEGFIVRALTYGYAQQSNVDPDITTSRNVSPPWVYIVYSAYWPGNWEIIYQRLDNRSNTRDVVRLTYSRTHSICPAVDFDTSSRNIHVSYSDGWRGNMDVRHVKISAPGDLYSAFKVQRVIWGTGDASYSTVTSAGAGAYVAWMDNSSGNYEIYVKYGF